MEARAGRCRVSLAERLTELAPGFWAARSRLFETNSGIFTSGASACLIDPGIYPDEIDELAQFARERGLEITSLLLTHSHWDHILGAERIPAREIAAHTHFTISASAGEAIIRHEITQWEQSSGIQREAPFVIPHPTRPFFLEEDLPVGASSLRLIAAPGHTADQCAAYHAESGTLWAADMLSDLEIPFISYRLADYQATLERIAALDIRALAPGHGNPTRDPAEIAARLTGDRAYLAELSAHVHEAVRQGKTLQETVEACAGIWYRQNAEENARPHRLNIESAYLEAGGIADPAYTGWKQYG